MAAELGLDGHVHPQSFYHWFQSAIYAASSEGGWPAERRLAEGFVVLQTRHDSEFYAWPGERDSVRVVSRLVDARRLRGTWLQEVYQSRDGKLLARNYSTGVFLDLEGRPTTPPARMLEDLRRGPEHRTT